MELSEHHFRVYFCWLYLYQKHKETAVETDEVGNVDIAEKPYQKSTLALISNLFIRALACVHSPKMPPSKNYDEAFHLCPRTIHKAF